MVTSTNSLSLDLEWPADPSATNPEELFAAGYSACFNGKKNASALGFGGEEWFRRQKLRFQWPETARPETAARNCGRKLRVWGAGALQLMLQNADVEHKGTSVQVECDLGKVEGARRPSCPPCAPPTPPAQSP